MWRKRNQCHRSERVLNQGFPLSSLMSTFVFSSQHRDAEYRSLVEGRLFVVRSPFTLWVPLALPHLVCRCSLHLEVVSLFFNDCREGCLRCVCLLLQDLGEDFFHSESFVCVHVQYSVFSNVVRGNGVIHRGQKPASRG